MKLGLVSSCVPLIPGGGRNIVDWLQAKLIEYGHRSEIVYIPNTDDPDTIIEQMAAFRLLSLDNYFDRVITFRPPAHVVRHPHKIVWFIHHIRFFYDLWNSEYYPIPDLAPWRELRAAVIRADTAALSEAQKVFTNSKVVGNRLKTYNGIDSEVLYPPILQADLFQAGEYGDEIVCVSRMQLHKRQDLLVEAMHHTRTGVRLRLCGDSTSEQYVQSLREMVERWSLGDKVTIENRWISEDEKAKVLSSALAAAYVAHDEDSYGYSTIEAAQAARCTVTVSDAGGVLEFVLDGVNGYVTAPTAAELAQAFDNLYADRQKAREMGEAARHRLSELGINWETVLAKLLS